MSMSAQAEAPARHKRHSLHHVASLKKRRKVDQTSVSKSPSPHAHPPKPLLLPPTSFKRPGIPLLLGTGDIGQLGLGPDILERSRPTRFTKNSLPNLNLEEADLETSTLQVCAGGMHTVILTTAGRVITFGCNDEGALGRTVASQDDPPTDSQEKPDSQNGNSTPRDAITGETYPAYVPLSLGLKIAMVSAGDSHTAALDSDGQVWIWGTFRGPSGPIGLTQEGEISMLPRRLLDPTVHTANQSEGGRHTATSMSSHLMPGTKVVKIASGQDHLVCLTEEGRLYTMGSAEQGQLGRIAERFSRTGGRSGINSLLYPTECRVRGTVRFSDTWAGGFATFARCQATGAIYACGLNNYGQLGLKKPIQHSHNGAASGSLEEDEESAGEGDTNEGDLSVDAALVIADRNEADKSEAALVARQGPLIQFMLTRARAFDPAREWRQFAVGMHHTLALDKEGHVYALGRPDYGRLGLGSTVATSNTSVSQPTRVRGLLDDCTCVWIGSGEACSFAVDSKGVAYSWGIASSQQLGHGGEDDGDCVEPAIMTGKQLKERFVSLIDAGGQHTVLLAHSTPVNPTELSTEDDVIMTDAHQMDDSINGGCIQNSAQERQLDQKSTVAEQPVTETPTTQITEQSSKEELQVPVVQQEPILNPPVASILPSAPKRNRRLSPCSTTVPGAESTAGSTAGATINTSIHSSAVSDTSSVGSCGSATSASSQLNSAKSTDGGGSSRCSSFGTFSVQSSLPVGPAPESDTPAPSSANNSLMLDPLSASLLVGARPPPGSTMGRVGCSVVSSRSGNSAQIRSAGMSICSTSSEPGGIPTDTISLGSMTASPVDFTGGDSSTN